MSSVLRKLSIIAYRGIGDLVIDDLSPMSLIVGANNAGKSSVLEAAGLFLRPADPTQWVSAVRNRDSDVSLIDGLWSLFPNSEAVHPEDSPQQSDAMIVEGVTSGGPRRVYSQCVTSIVLGTSEAADLSARIEVSVDSDPPLILKFPAPVVVSHQIPTYRVFAVTPATHYSTNALVEHLSRVVDEGKKEVAVQLLRVFDSNVEDLDVVTSQGRKAVRVTHRLRGVVDLNSFGDGMRRSATLALALTRASQGVLLVDEIEAGIHHSALRPVLGKLLDAAVASQVQVLAATHSLEAVDAIIGAVEERGTPEALSAFWLQRQEAHHEVRRYDFAKLCTLREGGLDIR